MPRHTKKLHLHRHPAIKTTLPAHEQAARGRRRQAAALPGIPGSRPRKTTRPPFDPSTLHTLPKFLE